MATELTVVCKIGPLRVEIIDHIGASMQKQLNVFEALASLTVRNEKDIDEHLATLFALTLSMKPTNIVELGVRTARSTLAFLAASNIVGSHVTSVDLEIPRPDFGFPLEWQQRWTFHHKNALAFLEEDFPNLKNTWQETKEDYSYYNTNRCDIIYIDDWHAGDHVEREISLIEDFVTPKDLVILHDLMYDNSQPCYKSVDNPRDPQWGTGGPYRAISKLDLEKWEYMTIPRCNGLTLLRKKSQTLITED